MDRKNNGYLLFIVWILSSAPLFAKPAKFRLTVGTHYFTGHFQEQEKTNILYVPVSLKYKQFPWGTRITVPYLKMQGNTAINLVGEGQAQPQNYRRDAEGLGDIILTQTYQYQPKFIKRSVFNFSLKVKLPTASVSRGLGTGKYDVSLESRFIKNIGQYTPFITLGYKFVGKVDKVQLNNRFYTVVGSSYRFHPQFQGGLMYEYLQASSKRRVSDQKIVGFCSWKLEPKGHWTANAYSLFGLTRASAEYGGGLSFSYTF